MRSKGRVSLWRTRSHKISRSASSQTAMPICSITSRLASARNAPPPVDTMPGGPESKRRSTSASRFRKNASPSRANMSAILDAAACSMAASLSTKGTLSCCAKARPTAVLPDPIIPTSTTVRFNWYCGPSDIVCTPSFSAIQRRTQNLFNECRDLVRKAIYNPFHKWERTHI